METGLTKAEESHVERMSEPFSEPTMSERFEEWAGRSISHSKKDAKEKEGKYGPREVNLKGEPDEYREWVSKVGAKGEKDAAKPADEHANTKGTEKPAAKAGEKSAARESDDSPSEPLAGDLAERHWQGKLQGPEVEKHINQVNNRAGL